MSLILDALRKMEEDRKTRRSAAQDIRPEVLRYRAAIKPRQEGKPYLLLFVAVVLVAAGIAAGIFLRGGGAVSSQESAPVAMAVQASAAPTVQATQSAPAIPTTVMQTPAIVPAVPAPAVAVPTIPAPAPALAAPASQPVAAASPVDSSGSRRHGRKAAAARRTEAASQPQSPPRNRDLRQELQTLPEITISGIAWQDERGLRRAVLNGALVGEGAEVAGARVVEIRENKVRVSRGGQLFDLVFASSQSSR